MSVVVLPKSFNLGERIEAIPDGTTSKLITCRPVSGATFSQSQIMEFDLQNFGWLVPQSLSIRYKVRVNTDASGAAILGTPVFTPFQRVSTLVGGSSIDTVNSYNQCMQLYVNGYMDVANKYGYQQGFGYTNTTGAMTFLDGRGLDALIADASGNSTMTLSAPLYGLLLSSAEKNLPLFAMPSVRLQFTLDSLANMSFIKLGAVGTGYSALTKFEIYNAEVCYTCVDMGAGVEAMVRSLGPAISIKAHGLSNTQVSVPSGTSGSQSYVFNQRFASIRSAYLCATRADGASNKWAGFVDLTTNNGDYQLSIAGNPYPPTVLSTALNHAGILTETRRAFGSLFDFKNAMSINTTEFDADINDSSANALYYEPGKFIVGINLSRVGDDDKVMMSGVSTYNSPINANISCNTATTVAANLSLILDYDAILVLDPVANQLSVRS
jgi:hypothetical protein